MGFFPKCFYPLLTYMFVYSVPCKTINTYTSSYYSPLQSLNIHAFKIYSLALNSLIFMTPPWITSRKGKALKKNLSQFMFPPHIPQQWPHLHSPCAPSVVRCSTAGLQGISTCLTLLSGSTSSELCSVLISQIMSFKISWATENNVDQEPLCQDHLKGTLLQCRIQDLTSDLLNWISGKITWRTHTFPKHFKHPFAHRSLGPLVKQKWIRKVYPGKCPLPTLSSALKYPGLMP
jgi:hypothetical protein